MPAAGGVTECTALVDLAERMRDSAPELSAQFARRALITGESSDATTRMRAQALFAAGLVQLGHYASAVEPALAALHAAETAGATRLATAVRLDLAACARGIGEPVAGCAILAPVLADREVPSGLRGVALGQLVSCTTFVGRRDDLEDALTEADRLLAADGTIGKDSRQVERARLQARAAAYFRWYGDTEDAASAARSGLAALRSLQDAQQEGGRIYAKLILELVCALLDDSELSEAEEAAEPLLTRPVRAAAAPAVGSLLLAVGTRVYLPTGRITLGRGVLGHASWVAERHGLEWLLADSMNELSHLEEQAGQALAALHALRAAHAAEHRQLRAVGTAKRLMLGEFGVGDRDPATVTSLLRSVIRPAAPTPVQRPTQPPSGPHTVGAARRQEAKPAAVTESRSRPEPARNNGEPPVPLTLVRLQPVCADSSERTDADEADQPTGDTSAGKEWTNGISASAALRRIHDTAAAARGSGEPEEDRRSAATEFRHRGRDGRSVLSMLSIQAGSGGRRRADNGLSGAEPPAAADDHDEPVAPESELDDSGMTHRRRTDSSDLANLLAEALAAYRSTAESTAEPTVAEPARSAVHRLPDQPAGSASESGVSGRHRSPE